MQSELSAGKPVQALVPVVVLTVTVNVADVDVLVVVEVTVTHVPHMTGQIFWISPPMLDPN